MGVIEVVNLVFWPEKIYFLSIWSYRYNPIPLELYIAIRSSFFEDIKFGKGDDKL